CNPNTDKKCFARDAALATSIFEPFTSSSKRFRPLADSPGISYCDNGAKLTMTKRFDNPSIVSNFYILYGKVEVEIKAAAGTGIISSFYLQSDDLDEIDVAEVFGGDIYEFQTNFFVKGNTTTYDRGGYHPMPVPPMQEFNKYGIEWTPQKLIWTLNGVPVRTLTNDTPHGFPNSPMDIKFSLWAGGDPDNEQGTIDWAGGITQYTQLPFSMYVKNMYAMDYSTGIEYNYGNSWDGKWIELRSNQGSIY
ncbi:hydrolase activity, hydrolyzing O-glycosyl compounds, partial [Scheffersomyces stipitis CBS 6054]